MQFSRALLDAGEVLFATVRKASEKKEKSRARKIRKQIRISSGKFSVLNLDEMETLNE